MTVDSPIKFTPSLPGQPVPEWGKISNGRPVFRAELPDGRIVWLVSGYENVRQMLIDPRFSRALAVAPDRGAQGFEMMAAESINGMDPPEHTRLRKLVASAFTARRVEALRPRIATIVTELIDALVDRPQPVDLVSAFSLPLPAQVICEMLGVPAADTEQFHAWSDIVLGDWQSDTDEIMTAVIELFGYFGKLIAIKRTQPTDDLMSELIAARDDTDRLSEHELTVLCCTLLIAGHETTANQVNLSLLLLFDHPDEVARLRADPALIPTAVEELLRFSRLGGLAPPRVTSEDVRIGGVVIPAGEWAVPLFSSANRDPSIFSDPTRFDITREASVGHLTFGAGAHHCLGAQLARLELQEAFRGLIGRLPGLRLAVPASELQFKPGMAIHSLRALPVRWDGL